MGLGKPVPSTFADLCTSTAIDPTVAPVYSWNIFMELRRTRRFMLYRPLSIIRSGAELMALAGHTKNISSGGVLFTTETEPDMALPIEYVIILNQECSQPVNLRCIGKVIRTERLDTGSAPGAGFQVAATMERHEFIRAQ